MVKGGEGDKERSESRARQGLVFTLLLRRPPPFFLSSQERLSPVFRLLFLPLQKRKEEVRSFDAGGLLTLLLLRLAEGSSCLNGLLSVYSCRCDHTTYAFPSTSHKEACPAPPPPPLPPPQLLIFSAGHSFFSLSSLFAPSGSE